MRDNVRLLHIFDATNEILAYTKGINYETFLESSLIKYACVKQIEIIGEAAGKLSSEIYQQSPQIPWRQLVGMRNRLVHEYFGIDFDVIWEIIQ